MLAIVQTIVHKKAEMSCKRMACCNYLASYQGKTTLTRKENSGPCATISENAVMHWYFLIANSDDSNEECRRKNFILAKKQLHSKAYEAIDWFMELNYFKNKVTLYCCY